MPPSTMKAIKVVDEAVAEIQEAPVPSVKGEWILVKVKYVALNPTDWKHIDWMPHPGATVGCDYAGTVEAVGPDVKGEWKQGDRIAGVTHGCNSLDLTQGTFAEYALVKEGLSFKIPDNVEDEEAASLGVALVTVGLALFQQLTLPLPGSISADIPVLIYGGSSATGTIAIQFAKLAGAKVITTCSPKNFDLAYSVGADEALDYNDPECAERIRWYTKDKLHYILDCVGGELGGKIISEAISPQGGQICTIVPGTEYTSPNTRVKLVMAYSGEGEPYSVAGIENLEGVPEDYDFVSMFGRLATKLLAEGKVKGHPRRVGEGFEGVLEGLNEMREGKVSGLKLVYKI